MKIGIEITPNACFYKVISLDNGKEIKNCIYADDEKGMYIIYATDKSGTIKFETVDGEKQPTEIQKFGNIKIIPPTDKNYDSKSI